jgi:hypothetical protein
MVSRKGEDRRETTKKMSPRIDGHLARLAAGSNAADVWPYRVRIFHIINPAAEADRDILATGFKDSALIAQLLDNLLAFYQINMLPRAFRLPTIRPRGAGGGFHPSDFAQSDIIPRIR